MGTVFSKKAHSDMSNLRLATQKITAFSGDYQEFAQWKKSTAQPRKKKALHFKIHQACFDPTAVTKEMDGLQQLCVFDFHSPNTRFSRNNGWQFAPMHMIFDIKADGRFKAGLCVGGNVLDCSEHTTYSSTI
jgi:hypothetical protein